MSVYINCESLTKKYSLKVLFENLSFAISSGDRVGLIGPNGSGKSTLLKILSAQECQDFGKISIKKELEIGYVPQSEDFPSIPVEEVLLHAITSNPEKQLIVETYLSKFGFKDGLLKANQLSGGWKKRLSLAKVMLRKPDILLLDEPTNHLDLESIVWLEKFLLRESKTFLFVSHDRLFLQRLCNRVIELDPTYPNGMFAIDRPFLEFLQYKEQFLLGQLQQEKSLASKMRKESEWLKSSPKARTTKSRSRIESAEEDLLELRNLKNRNLKKSADLQFSSSKRGTKNLVVAKNLQKSMGEKKMFHKLDFTLSPGTKLALMGSNGTGKTTLLKIITGELLPDSGTIKRADLLKVVYFDQEKQKIPAHLTLKEALAPMGDFVVFQKQRIHVNGWCKRFLFSPDMLCRPISTLSGGERARIAIAHLMLEPADVLLLDEPTNDLDISTLETLEESLIEFPGALVLISHDRMMLDRVCNSFLLLENNRTPAFFADYSQWEYAQNVVCETTKKIVAREEVPKKRKLSYLEKKEYEGIEKKLQQTESEIHVLNLQLEDPVYAENPQMLQQICEEIGVLHARIEQLYLRFEELDRLREVSN